MKLWNKKDDSLNPLRPDRIRKMDDGQLKNWLNTSLMELGATYDHWSYHGGTAKEVDKVLNIVKDLWDELQSRASV